MGQPFCTCSDELDQPRRRRNVAQPLLRDYAAEIRSNQNAELQKKDAKEAAASYKNLSSTANGLASPFKQNYIEESTGDKRRRQKNARPPRIRKCSSPETADEQIRRGRPGPMPSVNGAEKRIRDLSKVGPAGNQRWIRMDTVSEDEASLVTGPSSPKPTTRPYRNEVNQMPLPPQMLENANAFPLAQGMEDRENSTTSQSCISDPGSNPMLCSKTQSSRTNTPSRNSPLRSATPVPSPHFGLGSGCEPVAVHVANLPFNIVDTELIRRELENGCGVRITRMVLALRKYGRRSLGHATVWAASEYEAETMKACSEKVFVAGRAARIETLKPKEPEPKRAKSGGSRGRRGRRRQKKAFVSYYDTQINS